MLVFFFSFLQNWRGKDKFGSVVFVLPENKCEGERILVGVRLALHLDPTLSLNLLRARIEDLEVRALEDDNLVLLRPGGNRSNGHLRPVAELWQLD